MLAMDIANDVCDLIEQRGGRRISSDDIRDKIKHRLTFVADLDVLFKSLVSVDCHGEYFTPKRQVECIEQLYKQVHERTYHLFELITMMGLFIPELGQEFYQRIEHMKQIHATKPGDNCVCGP